MNSQNLRNSGTEKTRTSGFKERINDLINKYETKTEFTQMFGYTMRQKFIDDYY